MDIILICTICSGLVIVFLFYFLFKVQKRKINPHAQEEVPAQVPRRAIGNRNRIRGQPVARAGAQNVDDEQVEGTDEPAPDLKGDAKMGAKKRAKLEAKAEKKAQRENELKLREHRKKQQEREELERKQKEEKEKLEEQKIEEEKKRLQEEKERKEEEEYLKMKEGFTVEEEGFDEEGQTESQNLLQEFISHIKEKKVVMLEDLAGTFHLRIQTVINRIEELLANGTLTGVIDDRGKFIYITVEELQAVADFVKKRGRVTIQELVENSNKLITIH